MGLLSGKKGIILGVANNRSIATGIAKRFSQEGAELGFNFLDSDNNKMEGRVHKAIDLLNPKFIAPCNVNDDKSIRNFFDVAKGHMSSIDFLIHSIAFAPLEDIKNSTINTSRSGFKEALETSVYSFIATAKEAAKIMPEGGSLITITYLGAERVVPGYNVMGIAKAALEATVKYLAYDLGSKNIRVNAVSAGAIKTLASSAIKNFNKMLNIGENLSPLKRNVTSEHVGNASLYLVSDLSSGTTGEIHHVDNGYNILAAQPVANEPS